MKYGQLIIAATIFLVAALASEDIIEAIDRNTAALSCDVPTEMYGMNDSLKGHG